MSQRLDHHGLTNLSGFDAGEGRLKIRIETAHEAELQKYFVSLRRGDHFITLFDRQRHWFLAEDMLAAGGRDDGQFPVCEGGSRDDDGVERNAVDGLLESAEFRLDFEAAGRFLQGGGIGVYEGDEFALGHMLDE